MKRALIAAALVACGGPTKQVEVELDLPPAVAAACAGVERGNGGIARCAGALADFTARVTRRRYADPALSGYVQRVADRVAAAARSEPVRIRVLDESGVVGEGNVGGFIYLSRGTLAVLDNEAELAGLLGHEIGHVVAGHAIDGLNSRGGTVEHQVEEERLADELAVVFVRRARYRADAVATMLARLLDDDGDRRPTLDHPHPIRAARVARVALLAEAASGGGELGRERYLDAIDGLVVGRDPRAGFVVGNRFVHARAGLAVRWPDGWVVETARLGAVATRERARTEVAVVPTDLARLAIEDGAVVVVGDRGLSVLITGPRATSAETSRPPPLALDPVQPARLVVLRAPRRASARALIRQLCQAPKLALAIERDLDSERAAGSPIKCVTAGGRAW